MEIDRSKISFRSLRNSLREGAAAIKAEKKFHRENPYPREDRFPNRAEYLQAVDAWREGYAKLVRAPSADLFTAMCCLKAFLRGKQHITRRRVQREGVHVVVEVTMEENVALAKAVLADFLRTEESVAA